MSQSSALERIRSLTDEKAIYEAFDAYPWTKDKTFMSGLFELIGDPDGQSIQPVSSVMATQVRMFYYAKYIGVQIDFDKYQSWVSQNPNHKVPSILPENYTAEKAGPAPEVTTRTDEENTEPATVAASLEKENKNAIPDETVSPKKEETEPTSTSSTPGPIPEWQKAAPIVDLYVKKDSAATSERPELPSYPGAFAEMLKLIQEGKPVPGIREIPNTVIRDPSIKPVGQKVVPRKPWEKDNAPDPVQHETVEASTALDNEFPPLDK